MRIKRFTALLLSALLAATALPVGALNGAETDNTAVTPDTLIGDADLNGVVGISDATTVQRYLISETKELSEDMRRVMDVTGDGLVSILDVTEIQRFAAEFNCDSLIGKRFGDVYPETEPTTELVEETTEPVEETTEYVEETTESVEETTEFVEETTELVEETTEYVEETTEPVEELYLTLNAHELKLGDSDVFQLSISTNAASDTAPVFTSGDTEIADVSEEGLVQPKKAGSVEITCTLGELSDTCAVTVCPSATSLRLNKTELTLAVGETYDLDSYVNSGAAAYHRMYSSDNEKVASATLSGGIVTALSAGTARVSCTLLNGVSAVCTVTVLPAATSIALNSTAVSLGIGGTFDFNSNVPTGTAAYYRDYFSEDPEIVTIQKSGGLATGKKEGTMRIYVQIRGDVRAYATVTVVSGMRSVMVDHLRAQVGNGNSSYVKYINSHSSLGVSNSFPWCAVFGWCMLDQFATLAGKTNPVPACKHVSDIAMGARSKGALHNRLDNDYTPKPGDLFTTASIPRPYDGGRDHIGYVEYVETDKNGKVTKVHTIEGNYAWETNGAVYTRVWRSTWVPGVKNEYGSVLCEYIDLEKLFS